MDLLNDSYSEQISINEVSQAIKHMKIYTSPGPYAISQNKKM